MGLKVEDVRRMHQCDKCQGIGIYRPSEPTFNIPLVVRFGQKKYVHPACLPIEVLVLLSDEELGEIRRM